MISVIVPVYNCENYLQRSIQSLLKQTIFNQLEIIFVDDGSTDRSPFIIQEYVNQYSNMKLVHQYNMGVSSARNHGIKESTGEYIAFFDGDDIALDSLYEKLLQLIENNKVDLSCVNYLMCFSDGVTKIHKKQEKKIICKEEILKSFLSENLLCTNVFDKLFKASIAKKIVFPKGYAIGEDMFFIFQYLQLSKKVAIDTTNSLYLYCIRSDSAMKSKFSAKYFDPVILSRKIMDILSSDQTLYLYAEANFIHETCKTMALYYQNKNVEYSETIMAYKNNLKSYSLQKACKYMSKKHFISFLLMRLSPKIYINLYKFLHIG